MGAVPWVSPCGSSTYRAPAGAVDAWPELARWCDDVDAGGGDAGFHEYSAGGSGAGTLIRHMPSGSGAVSGVLPQRACGIVGSRGGPARGAVSLLVMTSSEFLQRRSSSPRLVEPAPTAEWRVFSRPRCSPDRLFATVALHHHRQRPARGIFGLVLERCLRQRNPSADEAALAKARNAPLRAPHWSWWWQGSARTPKGAGG